MMLWRSVNVYEVSLVQAKFVGIGDARVIYDFLRAPSGSRGSKANKTMSHKYEILLKSDKVLLHTYLL